MIAWTASPTSIACARQVAALRLLAQRSGLLDIPMLMLERRVALDRTDAVSALDRPGDLTGVRARFAGAASSSSGMRQAYEEDRISPQRPLRDMKTRHGSMKPIVMKKIDEDLSVFPEDKKLYAVDAIAAVAMNIWPCHRRAMSASARDLHASHFR